MHSTRHFLPWTPGSIILILAVAVFLLQDITWYASPELQAKERIALAACNTSLGPAELPGYTGWARPKETLAGWFDVILVKSLPPRVEAGINITFGIACRHELGKHGGSAFYVRAYGPTVVAGLYKDHEDGTYDILLPPLDAGVYQVEVVLSFSKLISWNDYPQTDGSPGFEGYLVPGFPKRVQAVGDVLLEKCSVPHHIQICRSSSILQTSFNAGLYQGRWKIHGKVVHGDYHDGARFESINFDDYATGESSIGLSMEYISSSGCRLMTEPEIQNISWSLAPNTTNGAQHIHLVIIGDSNFDAQRGLLEQYFKPQQQQWLHISYIMTQGGLYQKLPEIQAELDKLAKLNHTFFVLFNSGLHDLDRLCTREEYRLEYVNVPKNSTFSCYQAYSAVMKQFVDIVMSFTARLHVWQTTTAAWPKWGNGGMIWPPTMTQKLPLDPTGVFHLNRIAWNILREHKVKIMDGYWLTLSRPDHRQPIVKNRAGGRLVHPGPEVYSVLTRQWIMLVVEAMNEVGV